MTKKKLAQWLPLVLIGALLAAFFFSNLHHELTVTNLKHHLRGIQQFCNAHPVLAPLALTACYVLIVAIPTPLPWLFNVTAGFLFPLTTATIIATVGETLGGIILFKAVHSSLGAWLQQSSSKKTQTVTQNMKTNAWVYIATLRLTVFFPAAILNIAAGLAQLPTKQYALITFCSCIPVAFIFAFIGKGLGTLFQSDQPISLLSLFNTPTILGLCCMIALVIAANFHQRRKK